MEKEKGGEKKDDGGHHRTDGEISGISSAIENTRKL